MRLLVLIILNSIVISAFALPEVPDSGLARQSFMLNLALTGEGSFFTVGEFVSQNAKVNGDSLTLSYHKFGEEKGPRGAIVVSPGFGEASLKYVEMAHDLLAMGYSPIYVMNHRGQGSSDRVLPDPEDRMKGYVRSFDNVVLDFNDFVQKIVLKDQNVDSKKMFLLAHSMGGAVATLYIRKYDNPFSRVLISSPMLNVRNYVTSYKIDVLDGVSLGVASLLCAFTFCDSYAPFTKGDWKINRDTFVDNRLTSDENRFAFIQALLVTHHDTLPTGAATNSWGIESIRGANQAALESPYFLVENNKHYKREGREKDFRLTIFQAGADEVVDNIGQDRLCSNLIRVPSIPLYKYCTLVKEPFLNAKHEIFMETDDIRNEALKRIGEFFQ